MSDNSDVQAFHERFDLDHTGNGVGFRGTLDDIMEFRIKFLEEELQEFKDAYALGDEAGMFDALLDLVYVAHGTAHFKGFPWQEGWDEVQAANMTKVRAQRPSQSKRGSTFDVVKPKGFKPPDIEGVLRTHGFPAGRCSSCGTVIAELPNLPLVVYLGNRLFCNSAHYQNWMKTEDAHLSSNDDDGASRHDVRESDLE